MMEWMKAHHVGMKLIAILAAIALWAFAIATDNPERTMEYDNINVQFIGQAAIRSSHDLVVTEISNPQVSVRLRGNFTRLGEIEDRSIIVRADLSNFTEPGTFLVDYDISVPNGLTVDSKNPEKLRVTIDRYVDKELEVLVLYEGEMAQGLDAGDAQISPSTIRVSGIESVLNEAKYAVVTVNASEFYDSYEGDHEFFVADADGKPLDSEYTGRIDELVHISIPVYLTKDLPLYVEKIGNEVVSPDNMVVALSMDAIAVHGDAQLVRGLEGITLGTIDIRDFLDTETINFPVELPEGVRFAGSQINSVNATVTLDGIEDRQITLEDFQVEVDPEDVNIAVETLNVLVTVRGRTDAVRELSAQDFRAVVDISEHPPTGRQMTPLKITCQREGVEIWGVYNVVVDVTQAKK